MASKMIKINEKWLLISFLFGFIKHFYKKIFEFNKKMIGFYDRKI